MTPGQKCKYLHSSHVGSRGIRTSYTLLPSTPPIQLFLSIFFGFLFSISVISPIENYLDFFLGVKYSTFSGSSLTQ